MEIKKFILSLFFFLIFTTHSFASQIINKIVAVVGDEFLTLYDLDEMCKPYFERFIKPDLPLEEKEKIKNQIRRNILKGWIEESVLKIEAQRYGLTVSDEELKRLLNEEINSIGGEEVFKEYLKKQGISYEEYKEKVRDKILKYKFVQIQLKGKVVITEEELKKAYEETIKNYDPSPKYWLSILIINGDEKLASSIYEEILKGKSFEEVYKTYPTNVQLIKDEPFKKDELVSEILEKLKNISPGEVTPVIKKDEKYYIIRLLKIEEGTPPSFEEMKEKLYQKLFELKAQTVLEKWINELEEKRYIKIYL
ncbi:SurA domain protein [Thermodesulfobacterium geofontis OPF15]|jgi:peptidyl-prolyl cis-trans isomerase SurA|uniref:peptidylprolyl isomerase n=1 Tax=Thermodesulfobacterium geofontis (strain OPF15) TaxID=795359 RepID=F8C362_THEGP|nr:peptidyl-prolyl cis-trans isomerase [Thermodesulfobacterium geofontis]AEH22372.1 SurA domain protein [Thermodesulfobacterium geofontis OPF15]